MSLSWSEEDKPLVKKGRGEKAEAGCQRSGNRGQGTGVREQGVRGQETGSRIQKAENSRTVGRLDSQTVAPPRQAFLSSFYNPEFRTQTIGHRDQ